MKTIKRHATRGPRGLVSKTVKTLIKRGDLSDKEICITNGDRIAQAVLMPVYNGKLVTLEKVDEITKETDRGSGGFGHSGIK